MEGERVVALALLTARELELLGVTPDRVFAIHEVPCSGRLLAAIDEADRRFWREHDRRAAAPSAAAALEPQLVD